MGMFAYSNKGMTMRRDVKRVSILAAMAICMATGVDANQYMTLESREGVAIANKSLLSSFEKSEINFYTSNT